jgi:hypothetical protein
VYRCFPICVSFIAVVTLWELDPEVIYGVDDRVMWHHLENLVGSINIGWILAAAGLRRNILAVTSTVLGN